MDVIDYLKHVADYPFKEKEFNECDALILSVVSYFPFHKLNKPKNSYNTKELYERLVQYVSPGDNKRKQELLLLLKLMCQSERFKSAKFIHYKDEFDKDSYKQFRAVSVALNDFVFASFSGTDASKEGWIEDFNMSCMDIVPAEVEAENYIKKVSSSHPFRKIYCGGHSKGGRLAVRAAKSINNPNKLIAAYSFDGPNFKDDFYDDKYELIENKIHYYTPFESVFGRLITKEREPEIISSNEKFFLQHSYFSWEIDDDAFIRVEDYSKRSTYFVNTFNGVIDEYDDEKKQTIVQAITSILDKLEIEYLSGPDVFASALKRFVPMIPGLLKRTSKNDVALIVKSIGKIITSLLTNIVIMRN